MKKEQFGPLLAPIDKQMVWPVCDDAETNWANFLLAATRKKLSLTPTVWKDEGITITAIQKSSEIIGEGNIFGSHSFLILDPFPGLVATDHHRIIRPLRQAPHGFFRDVYLLQEVFDLRFSVLRTDEDWYPKGMMQLIHNAVDRYVDGSSFMETLREYERFIQEGGLFE